MSNYVELHLHTHYSFLDGASAPADLAARAADLGMPALAITDHQGLYGAVKFRNACRDYGIQPIYGAEVAVGGSPPAAAAGDRVKMGAGPQPAGGSIAVDPPAGHLTLLATSAAGWASLCRMLSAAGLAGAKHDRPVTWDLLERHADGLVCLTGCRDGVVAAAARRGDRAATLAAARRLAGIFGPDRCYVELQRHFDAGDRRLCATLIGVARHIGLPLVATNNVHYALPDGFRLQHVLACIRARATLATAGARLYATPHRHLKDGSAMADLFADVPEAVANTLRIAERCAFTLDLTDARLPAFPVPAGETAFSHLLALCYAGLRARFDPVTPAAAAQLTRELAVIEARGLADYFLVVHDIVTFARGRGILCQGRGSAAGSLVAYALGITPVDPLAHDLLFERFLAEDSHATPDIDVDFAGDRREEVIQYVYDRWGREHAAMVANVVTFQARSALADVGRVLGFPADVLADAAARVHARRAADLGADLGALGRFADRAGHLPWRLLGELCAAIDGCPRHLSIHVGGMLVTARPLAELVPLEPATMPGRVVVQWDKDDVEDAGLIKIDLLSLRTLGMVAECLDRVRAAGGPDLTVDAIPADDPEVWAMLGTADTLGCFQVESRAQMSLLPRLRPTGMHDLIVEVALIRPGPVQGGMAKAYLARRDGEAPVTCWHPDLVPVLAETLGVLVFQEQVLKVAMALAGFSGSQADGLRRAMSRKRSRAAMEALRAGFVAGAGARGVAAAVAGAVFDHLLGFAGYGFCKSHAAAFARLAYVTAWLKRHHPAAFYCALLNHQPMGFYPTRVVVEDARRHGLALRPLDVNRSGAAWAVEDGALRVPLGRLKGLPAAVAAGIVAARAQDGPFTSLWDFVRRTRAPRRAVERLIQAGALDGLPVDARGEDARGGRGGPLSRIGPAHRRQALWDLGEMRWDAGGLDLPPAVTPAAMAPDTLADAVAADAELLGLAQHAHPVALVRPALAARGAIPTREVEALPHGAAVRVAGRVEVVQRPGTAKGIAFVSLEDEHGLVNLVLYPQVYARDRDVLRRAAVVVADGRVQHDRGAVHVVATGLAGMAAGLADGG